MDMRFVAVRVTAVREWFDEARILLESSGTELALTAGAVLALVALWFVVRWIRRPKGKRLLRVLAQRDEVVVLMHPNPDPDAMASAIGVALLADEAGTDVTLQYPGQIRHQENRAFRTVLDLELESIDDVDNLASPHVVLVDHNEPRGFDGAEWIVPYAVIDHHPGNGTGESFTDVRPEYGSCSSIVTEYLREVGGRPANTPAVADARFVIPEAVATGLLYGIQADTKHLTSGCTEAEFSASAFLYPGIDEDSLDRIANPQVDVEVLEVKARAIGNRDVRGSFAVSDIGSISNVDAIPQAADELLQLEGVTAVVVYGTRNGTLHFSGRSRDDRVHMGKTLQMALEDAPGADAGGHARMGGGQVPVSGNGTETAVVSDVATVSWSNADITDRLFNTMNGDL